MEECKIKNLYNLDETIAKPLLENLTYPWEALPKISEYIIELGNKLDTEIYEIRGENIWIAKSANILANVGLSSFLLAVALPKLTFILRKKVTGSEAEPGLMGRDIKA